MYLCGVKKFSIIVVLFFYSLTSFGVSVNYFYCCGKLKEVSIKLDQPPVHEKCPMKGDKDCCKNKTVELKLTSQQEASQPILFEPLLLATILSSPTFDWGSPLISQGLFSQLQNRPPPLARTSLNILHSNFRI